MRIWVNLQNITCRYNPCFSLFYSIILFENFYCHSLDLKVWGKSSKPLNISKIHIWNNQIFNNIIPRSLENPQISQIQNAHILHILHITLWITIKSFQKPKILRNPNDFHSTLKSLMNLKIPKPQKFLQIRTLKPSNLAWFYEISKSALKTSQNHLEPNNRVTFLNLKNPFPNPWFFLVVWCVDKSVS